MRESDARESVLVTGASGFIGRHLCRMLLERGHEVHATTRSISGLNDPDLGHPGELDHPRLQWHEVDLESADEVRTTVAAVAPSRLFHLAGLVRGARDRALVLPALRANLLATVHLLEGAVEAGCQKFVLAGSLEEPPLAVSPPPPPSSPYAAAKIGATSYCRMYQELYELPVAVGRIFMVYGPGVQDSQRLVPYVVRGLLAGESLSFSSGIRPVDWVYVEDVARGLIELAWHPDDLDRPVDLGTGRLETVRRVVEMLYERVRPEIEPDFGGREDRQSEQVRRADIDASTTAVGWRAQLSLEEGLDRTVAWFRERDEAVRQS